jgi:hypothetical protein
MDTFKFSVTTTGATEVKAAGNFIRYKDVTNGAGASTIRVKTERGDSLVMDPNDKAKLPRSFERLTVTNEDGTETIEGRLIVGDGDFDSAQVTGEVAISGRNHTMTAVTAAAASAQALAANSNRTYLSIQNQHASDDVYIRTDGGAAAANNTSFKLGAGQTWEPYVAPRGQINVIRGGANDIALNVTQG